MVTRKYLKDYRLEDSLDARGKFRTKAVYVGGDYVFIAPESAGRREKRAIFWLTLAGWPLFIGALLPRSLAADTMYCVIPFAVCFMTLVFQCEAAMVLLRAVEPLRHEQADKISGRLPISAFLTAAFSAAALVALAVRAILTPGMLLWGDAVFAGLSALLCAASAAVWRLAGRFKTQKAE